MIIDNDLMVRVLMVGPLQQAAFVVEGIETTEQLAFLCNKQCDQVQGYLFSPPEPAEKAATMLDTPFLLGHCHASH